ncbi:hypothetical protein [Pontibacter ramchanderi]|uniref:Asparagine synthetase domain-containing protein n=1 Tax=Pontibacter ramchanderi TaxID=1179743 RepID=A0A2N3U902_9BACT|nr:hypothetical protein [Pontibacter ramchanderi]PKV63220.1 hypothetical protein BD749_3059 [Pontibacter ramchanderi]
MAKIFNLYYSSKSDKSNVRSLISKIQDWFEENYKDFEISIFNFDNQFRVVIGKHHSLYLNESEGLLGFADSYRIEDPKHYPDGNYFLFRKTNEYFEIASDQGNSRGIWYYSNNDFFIFSSLQEPIIKLIGGFDFNSQVVPWMLSSGTLGPGNSWDKRLNLLSRNESVKYFYGSGNVKVDNILEVPTQNRAFKKKEVFRLLPEKLKSSFKNINLNAGNTTHLLSGGIESRLLLLFFAKEKALPCLTWTDPSSLSQPLSDVSIAKDISKKLNLAHSILEINFDSGNQEFILKEFLRHGEGRIDHISGYIDGFSIWREIYNKDIEVIIRGDHNFGRYKAYGFEQMRQTLGFELVSDYRNLSTLSLQNNIKESFTKRENETLEEYSFRLGLDFRHTYVNAALNDLKLSFTEIYNPLLNNSIILFSQTIPPSFLEGKNMSKSLNDSILPGIPYAKYASTFSINDITLSLLNEYLKTELSKIDSRVWSLMGIPQDLVKSTLYFLENSTGKTKSNSIIKSLIPKKIKKLLASKGKKSLSYGKIALRLYILSAMYTKLSKH